MATAKAQRWAPAELIRVLLEAEVDGRERSMTETRRKRARFPAGKTFAAWDPARSSIPTPTQYALATLEWVGRHENLVVLGPSGTGKSHLLEALGHAVVDSALARWPGSPLKNSASWCGGTALTTRWPRLSLPCCGPTSSWSTTSACCR